MFNLNLILSHLDFRQRRNLQTPGKKSRKGGKKHSSKSAPERVHPYLPQKSKTKSVEIDMDNLDVETIKRIQNQYQSSIDGSEDVSHLRLRYRA